MRDISIRQLIPHSSPLTLVKTTDPGIMQIQNRATRLDQIPLLLATRWQTILQELFVLVNQVFQLPVLRCQGPNLRHVDVPHSLNVDWSAVAINSVVKLRIVLVHSRSFGVVEAVAARR